MYPELRLHPVIEPLHQLLLCSLQIGYPNVDCCSLRGLVRANDVMLIDVFIQPCDVGATSGTRGVGYRLSRAWSNGASVNERCM